MLSFTIVHNLSMYDVVWSSHKLMAYESHKSPKSSSDPSLAAHGALPEAWYVKLGNKQNELTKAVPHIPAHSRTICLQSWCKFSPVSMKWKDFLRVDFLIRKSLTSKRSTVWFEGSKRLACAKSWYCLTCSTSKSWELQNRSIAARLVEFWLAIFHALWQLEQSCGFSKFQLLDGQVMIVGRSFDRPSARQIWCITATWKQSSANLILDSALR